MGEAGSGHSLAKHPLLFRPLCIRIRYVELMVNFTLTKTATAKVSPPIVGLVALVRPRQWVKNGFIAAPLLLTPSAISWEAIWSVALGIAAFCAVSSAVYILNDFMDRNADREHPTKRLRPFASGVVRPTAGFPLMGLLLAVGLGVGLWLSALFAILLLVYLSVNVGYSLGLKHVGVLDVFIIASGFVLRVEAGALLVGVPATVWITIMTGLLALFLALGKRRDDFIKDMSSSHRRSLAGYNKPFLDSAVTVVLGALLVSYLIYTTDRDVLARMQSDNLLYSAPFVMAGIMRYLQIMFVEERSGDPTEIVLTDRFLIITIVGWALTMGLLIYV